MRGSSFLLRVLVLFIGIAGLTITLQAQFNASLRGTVADPSGAVVPGATVTLLDKDTNAKRVATTDANGIYTFSQLPPAPYRLTVERQGFKEKVLENVSIIAEQLNQLNVELQVGEVSQEVTVSGTTQALDAETATVSGTVTSNQIQHMPSYNRDVFQLAQLAPGVFGDAAQGNGGGSYNNPGNQGPGGSGGSQAGIFQTENGPQIQSAGGQYETNSISIDGISTVSAVWGGTSVITPSEDSVQEMKVVSNDYDAQYGRFSGAQIQVISKSGTNQLHGSAFFKASRPGLNAYQRWNGFSSESIYNSDGSLKTPAERGLNRDENRFNNYGGSLGGPIWKNKIFAFFNWETSPLSASSTAQGWYETPQFDALAASAYAGPIAKKYLTFPGTAPAGATLISSTCATLGLTQGVNCNQLPGGLDIGSPLTTGIGTQDLTYGGNSGAPGVGGGLDGVPDVGFYNTVNPTTTSQNQFNGRLDADLTDKDKLAFAIYWVPVSSTFYNGPIRPENLWHHSQVNDAFSLIWDHTFSPTLLNQARANAAGWRWNEIASNPQEPFGLPQDNILNIGPNGGFQYFGAPGPSDFNQWTYTYSDVLTKVLGRHDIKMGGDLTRLYYLNNAVYAARPSYNFSNIWDFLNDAPSGEGGEFNSATGVPFSNRQDDRENIWGFFVQDDFKLRPNLTINAGLRWSYFGSMYSKENNLDVITFGSGDPVTGIGARVGGHLYNPQKMNFGPVLGFAWSPNGFDNKLVVRGGFGIAYNQNEIAITANGYGNPPNAVQPFFNCPYPYTSNPTCAGTGILYQTATNINSLFGYPPNPAAVTTFGTNNLPTTPTNVTAFPANPKTIAIYHYSLDIQYQLPFSTVMSLGYQGNQGRHLLTQDQFNVIVASAGMPLNPLTPNIDYYQNNGDSNYNAMLATLNHTFSHTFQAEAMYTWSKAMDDGSGPYEEDPYPYNVDYGYGRSDYNVQDAFKLVGLWQPVIFHGAHNWAEKIVGGWSISGIWNWNSGFPWNPTYGITTSNLYYNSSGYGSLRPSAVAPGYGSSTSNGVFMGQTNPDFGGNGTTYFLSPTYTPGAIFPAFSAPPAPGIPRNSANGPHYNDVDATLSKAFGLPNNKILGEGARFEVRADFYNIFNKLNLNDSTMNTFLGAANPNGTISNFNSAFGTVGGALGSRTIQLQARFSF